MLGSLLIQPQMLARMQGRSAAEELADEAMALLHRIALDPAAVEAVLPALRSAGEALGARLAERVRTKLPQGLDALRGLLDPVVQRFTSLGGDVSSAPDLLLRVADALEALAGATGHLSDGAIRAFVRRVARIAEQDFGLTTAVLAGELRAFLADLRTALATASAGQTATRHALACLLGRVERELIPLMPVVGLGVDRLADLLIAELRRTGLAELRDQASCLLGKVQAVLRALADVARTIAAAGGAKSLPKVAAARPRARRGAARSVPAGGAVPGRSEDGRYCWYASWLYATRRQGFGTDTPGGIAFLQTICPGYPEDEVWLSSDGKTLVLRRAHGADEVLHRADTPFEWHQAPQFSGRAPAQPAVGADHAEHFVFPRLSAPFLEEWARVTAVLADAAAGLWHVIAMGTSPKEHACNIPLWLWKWSNAAAAGPAAPLASLIARKADWGMGGKYVFSPLVSMLSVILGSLEGVHTRTNAGNGFLQWLTLLGGDALNAFTIHTVTQAVRNISLAIFTLVNYDGAGQEPDGTDTRPRNWDVAGSLIGLVNTLVGVLFFKLIRREDHGLPIGGNPTPFLLWFFVGAPVAGFVGAFSGVLVGWAFSRTVTPGQLWKEPVKAAILGLVTFLVQMYVSMEGDTDDGRYNPSVDPEGNVFSPPRQPFAGYSSIDSTPYRLPLPAGQATFVGQANQGFFSHMRYGGTVQVYAYDFAHDLGDEILAVRDGTVVDWFDFLPDDTNLDLSNASNPDFATALQAASDAQTAGLLVSGQTGFNGNLTGNWNFVLIRHDTVDPAHDRDQGGATVVTFAEYGHGQTGGVRAAFAQRGIAPTNIIGTKVTRGQAVMRAGDTGVSFHNHLHLHVRAATAATPVPADPPPVPYPPILPTTLSPYTLPFVFAEARHVIGRDGPLRHLTWYRSENTKLS